MARLIQGFRSAGAPIFHAVRLYRADGTNVDIFRREAIEEGLRVLMPGTSGVELLEEVQPEPPVRLDPHSLMAGEVQAIGPNEWAYYKPRWGAFHETVLAPQLEALGVNTLVLCGCNYDTSGRATVYEAGARDYRVIMVPDAMSGVGEGATGDLGRIGVYLMTVESCLTWLEGRGSSAAA